MKARENPFATDCVLRVRYRLCGASWDELLARLAALGYRAAIVGPEGSGKTTLLEDLVVKLEALGYVTRWLGLDTANRTVPHGFLSGLTRRDLVLLDGADLVPPLAWRWINWRARRAGGLIITAHRAGRLPTLFECQTSPELLEQLVTEITGAGATASGVDSRELHDRHAGNLRDALRELYDRCARG